MTLTLTLQPHHPHYYPPPLSGDLCNGLPAAVGWLAAPGGDAGPRRSPLRVVDLVPAQNSGQLLTYAGWGLGMSRGIVGVGVAPRVVQAGPGMIAEQL